MKESSHKVKIGLGQEELNPYVIFIFLLRCVYSHLLVAKMRLRLKSE